MNTEDSITQSNCDQIDKRIVISFLPAPVVFRDNVEGDDRSNYELYLVEMLNSSKWIKEKFKTPFKHQEPQSRGECDAYSNDYGIDFKLGASKTELQARNLTSPQIQIIKQGFYSVCSSKIRGNIDAFILHTTLRTYTVDDLVEIAAGSTRIRSIENDLETFLHTVEVKKNLLLFFPYSFSVEKGNNLAGAELFDKVVSGLNVDFAQSLMYRTRVAPGYDTYFVTVCETVFMLMEFQEGKLVLRDTIPISDCPTYTHLFEYSRI